MSEANIMVPISLGELLDKIVILEIKEERIADDAKVANVRNELRMLRELRPTVVCGNPEIAGWERQLHEANVELWELEDRIRDKERSGDFGPEFVEIARLIYRTNDKRAQAKRMINVVCGSAIVEEKSYQPY